MQTRIVAIALVSPVLLALGGAQSDGDASPSGEALYGHHHCAGCHEVAAVPGLGVVPLEDLSERFTEEALAAFLSAPPPPMPALSFSDEERRALAAYLRARFP